jgi:hypothetical protein
MNVAWRWAMLALASSDVSGGICARNVCKDELDLVTGDIFPESRVQSFEQGRWRQEIAASQDDISRSGWEHGAEDHRPACAGNGPDNKNLGMPPGGSLAVICHVCSSVASRLPGTQSYALPCAPGPAAF